MRHVNQELKAQLSKKDKILLREIYHTLIGRVFSGNNISNNLPIHLSEKDPDKYVTMSSKEE